MKDEPIRKTFYFVFAIHLIAIIACFLQPNPKQKKKPLQVRTLTLPSRAATKSHMVTATPSAPSKQLEKHSPSTQPEKKRATPTKSTTKTSSSTPTKNRTATAKKTAPIQKKENGQVSHLLKELEETVAKIDEKRDKIIPSRQIDAPKWLHPLKIDTIKEIDNDGDVGDESYEQSLVGCLKESLDLPEFGEVKIELTLSINGDMMKLRVLESQSEKNKTYLEKNLKLMKFPPFGGLSSDKKRTFILTFCNDL